MSATVIYSSDWPELVVKDATEAFMVSADMNAYDDGLISAMDFKEMWNFHPDDDFSVVINIAD